MAGGGGADPFQSAQTAPASQNFANFDAFGLSSGGGFVSTPAVPQFASTPAAPQFVSPAAAHPFAGSGTVLQPQNPNAPKPSPPS